VSVDVSLVMPVWRPHLPWLRAAVASALGQRGCGVELLLVDDGDDVPVAGLLPEVVDARLRHLRIPHGGVSAARNAGLAAARGRYVRFVDADDELDPDSTARLLALAAPDAVAYEDTVLCDEQMRPTGRATSSLRGDIAVACLLGQFDSYHPSMLFPTDVARRAGGWDEGLSVCEDYDFVLRCLELAPAVPGPGTATYYRRHSTSASSRPAALAEARRGTRRVAQGYFERHPAARGTEVEREVWRRVYDEEVQAALYRGQPGVALGSATRLLRWSPRRAAVAYVRTARMLAGRARSAIRSPTAAAPRLPRERPRR
jgi:GT2 family glycosyltransferase